LDLISELENDPSVIALGVLALIFLILTLIIYAEELWFMCRVNSLTPNRNLVIFILTLYPVS
jgi:hypothetical protein